MIRPPSTMRGLYQNRHENRGARLVVPKKVREDQIRRRIGAAYARLHASGNDLASAIGRSAGQVTARKAGEGPGANFALEIDACERDGIDTEALFVALRSVQAQARAARILDDDLIDRYRAASEAEQRCEGEQNARQAALCWTGDLLALCDATEAEMIEDGRMLAYGYELASRGIDPREVTA